MSYGIRLKAVAAAAALLTASAMLGICAWALWSVFGAERAPPWRIVLEIDRDGPRQQDVTPREAIDRAIPVIEKRLDELAVSYRSVVADGEGRIIIDVPGSADPERLKKIGGVIGKAGRLELRMVDMAASLEDAQQGHIPPDDELLHTTDSAPRPLLVEKRIVISGDDIADSSASIDYRTGEPVVNFSFNSAGTRRFARATRDNVGRPFAIVLDGEVLSAPVIREPILRGIGQISGNFTAESATSLAVMLRGGALPANFSLVEIRRAEAAPARH
jgi:protein-export membrane protein SecD